MDGYKCSYLKLDKNPKGHQMTKKLLEIERKRQLTSNIEELIGRLQDIGFKLQSDFHEIDTYYSRDGCSGICGVRSDRQSNS